MGHMEQKAQWLESDSEDLFRAGAKVHPENHPGAEDDYPEDDPTLDEYFEEWIERKRKTAGKPATPYRYNQVYRNHISRWLGERKIRRIRRRDVMRMQTNLLDTISPKTVNYVIQLLKQILNDAVLDEIIAKNPAANIRRLKNTGASAAADTTHRALTQEEQAAFLHAAEGDWYYEYLAFLLCTGLRQGEASALTWADINVQANVIHVRRTLTYDRDGHIIAGPPKSEAGRRDIPMNEAIRRILASQRDKVEAKWGDGKTGAEDFVFPSSTGRVLHNATANNALERIQKRMAADGSQVPHFSAHALRDTFATRFIEQGGTPQTLKTLLGHSSLKMTMDLYAHVLPNTRQKEMDMVVILP